MKNKKLIYILLPLVFAIWVTIIIKVFSFVKVPQYVKDESVSIKDSQVKSKVDTFFIVAKYPDPFLKKEKSHEIKESNKGENIQDKELSDNSDIAIKNIKWPQLDYYGLVNNDNKNQKIGFLKIDKKDYLVRQGDTIEGIIFEYIINDSIKVNLKHESRVVRKR